MGFCRLSSRIAPQEGAGTKPFDQAWMLTRLTAFGLPVPSIQSNRSEILTDSSRAASSGSES